MARLGSAGLDKTRFFHGVYEMKQPDFKASIDATQIAKALSAIPVGGEITHEAIAAMCGRSFDRLRGAMATALGIVQREQRMVFASVRGVGYQRLNDAQIVDTFDQSSRRIRRIAARAAKKIVCVDYENLPNNAKVKHNTALSIIGAMSEMASVGSAKRIEKRIAECGTELTAAKAAIEALGIYEEKK